MKELTLRDLYNLMIKNHEETNKKIDNVRSELKSDINEINKRLDTHENALKKANLI